MYVAVKEFLKRFFMVKKIEASVGLQFMLSMGAAFAVLMVLGSFFVAEVLKEGQYRSLELRGRELSLFLGKAGTDALVARDLIALDGLVTEAVKAPDILYIYISDDAGNVVSNIHASFNYTDRELASFISAQDSQDVAVIASKTRLSMDALEVQSPIIESKSRIGTVTAGLSRASTKKWAGKLIWLLLGTSVIIVAALAGLVYWMVIRMIVRPTREELAVASKIASGDLSQTVRVRSVDELGNLGRGLNRMIIGLKSMVESVRIAAGNALSIWGEIKKTSDEITSGSRMQSESVEEAASSINEMHFALKEIAGNVDELHTTTESTSSSVIELATSVGEVAKTMAELSASIEETSAAITQMSSSIRQIAENVSALSASAEQTSTSTVQISASVREVESAAQESASLAEAVAVDAQQLGMKAIEKTIAGMGRIEANAKETAEVVHRLGERAESIGGILTVIEDITDQTGLLALNAAILAAQAGEHGKGFAVVAAQIRELASKTAASTQEIGMLIASVQEETRQTVAAIHEGDAIVKEGVNLAGNAGEALTKILERASRSRDMSRGISRAAAEQAQGIKQVSDAIQQINKMTHQFASAANQQKIGSEQIMRAAEKMRVITSFVKNSTDEQARAGKDITVSVEQMRQKVGMVKRGTEEVQAGSDLIVKAIDSIKDIAKTNVDMAAGLNVAMDVMSRQAALLNKEIEKFKTDAG